MGLLPLTENGFAVYLKRYDFSLVVGKRFFEIHASGVHKSNHYLYSMSEVFIYDHFIYLCAKYISKIGLLLKMRFTHLATRWQYRAVSERCPVATQTDVEKPMDLVYIDRPGYALITLDISNISDTFL